MSSSNNLFNILPSKIITSLFVLITLLLTGCGAGGGAADSKTGVLAPTTITISPATVSNVSIGLTTNFTAQGTYADGSTADITAQVTWTTADATVATIDNTGKATGHKAGSSTTIIASLSGVSSPPVTLNVNSKVISTINITTATASVPKGAPANFVATAVYSDSTSGTVTGSVTWSSGNSKVATLSSTGSTSTLDVGTADITASISVGPTVVTSNTVQLKVIAPVLASLSITPTSPASIPMKGKQQFSPTGVMTDGTTATLRSMSWTSSNTSIVAIDGNGLATGVSTGSSGITVSSGSIVSNQVLMNINSNIVLGGAVQGTSLGLTTAVSTYAGSGLAGSVDNTGILAQFNGADGITTDGNNLYVADTGNHKIRKIVISTGEVTTLAGSGSIGAVDATGTAASFYFPIGITTDGDNLYVGDTFNHKIRKIVIATGVVTTLAGAGTSGALDATGSAAKFYWPQGITNDGNNLYIADNGNNKIRKIVIDSGVVTTLAGSGSASFADAIGTAASFSSPHGITTDGTNLYVADGSNCRIRQIVIATGVVSTLAGTSTVGSVDATGIAATFNNPLGITTDGSNLYVSDSMNNKIRKIVIRTGVVTTIAGSGAAGSVNSTGTSASFYTPGGITTEGARLFVTDHNNNSIRQIQ